MNQNPVIFNMSNSKSSPSVGIQSYNSIESTKVSTLWGPYITGIGQITNGLNMFAFISSGSFHRIHLSGLILLLFRY